MLLFIDFKKRNKTMLFFLATPEYKNEQANTTRVKVHLRNGVAEIYEQHQDLMGKVENNLIEIETTFENKLERSVFVLQEAVFVVSNKGLDGNSDDPQTKIYVYARRAQEIGPNLSIDKLKAEYEQKSAVLKEEIRKLEEKKIDPLKKIINSKAILLKEDLEFISSTLMILTDLKS